MVGALYHQSEDHRPYEILIDEDDEDELDIKTESKVNLIKIKD